MYPIILIRILKSNPEQLKTTNQDEATPPEDLKRIKRSPQRTYWGIWGNWKETSQIWEKEEGTPKM